MTFVFRIIPSNAHVSPSSFFSGANEYAEIQHLAKPFICVKKQITLSLRQAKKGNSQYKQKSNSHNDEFSFYEAYTFASDF